MENQEGRYIIEYDTQTGEPIYSDGYRGERTQPEYQRAPEPQPMPEGNVYRFQNAEAVRPKKVKKGWTMPKIVLGAAMFGVIAAGCFFGVNAGLNALTGGAGESKPAEEIAQTRVEANTDNSKAVTTGAGGVTDIVNAVMPSVVGVANTTEVQDFFGQKIESKGEGSGFIVKQDGDELLVATNAHVVQNAKEIDVIFCDNESVKATVKGTSDSNDIALLTVDVKKLKESTKKAIKAATLRSDDVEVGELAIAIGNANGSGQSVTVGYVSAKDRTFAIGTTDAEGKTNTRPMIQTDAAINPGNSGGPLIDSKGRVIGITTSREFYASDGRDIVGMNYAIPMSDVVSVINDLMNREVLQDKEKGYLGITGENIDATAAKKYRMPEGVYVKSISDTGAAAKAGINQGDIITKIDGTEVKKIEDVKEIVNSKRIGTTIEVTVQRINGKEYEEQKIKVTLASKDTLDGLPQDESEDESGKQDDQNTQPSGDGYQIIPWGFN